MTGVEREIFSLLDLETAGMEQVKSAVDAGNLDAAAAAYLDYYRNRPAPVLPWASIGENDLTARTSGYDFLVDPPLGFTWRDRERIKEHIHTGKGYIAPRSAAGSLSPYTVVDLADLLLAERMEDDRIVYPIQELGIERPLDLLPHLVTHHFVAGLGL